MRISDWSSDVCSSDLLAAHQIGRLNAVGAFVDRGDARVAIMLRGAGFLDEAHAAMDLHAEARDLAADVGRVRLDQRDEDVGAHRSEEHTSELQSLMRISYAVFCLKKKNQLLRSQP